MPLDTFSHLRQAMYANGFKYGFARGSTTQKVISSNVSYRMHRRLTVFSRNISLINHVTATLAVNMAMNQQLQALRIIVYLYRIMSVYSIFVTHQTNCYETYVVTQNIMMTGL